MAPPQIDGQADEQIDNGETDDKQPGKEIELTGSYGDGRAAQAARGNAQRIVSLGFSGAKAVAAVKGSLRPH